MTFLPIVGRELRVAARRRSIYWTRAGAALAALIIGGWIMLIPDMRTPQHLGMALFVSLSIISYVYSLLAGLFTTADCLSEEKREGTLGLLFLTDLKGYDIVLGKLAATSMHAFYGMLAIFPVMAIPLLAGGVTGAEFWRVVLVSINNLLFSLAVGMFCSAISKDERKAIVLAFLIVLFFTALLPFFGFLSTHANALPKVCCLLSPSFSCFSAFDETYRMMKAAKTEFFYESVLSTFAMTVALLVGAGLVMPRTWQDRAESSGRIRWRARWLRWAHGSARTRQAIRQRMLQINPVYWLTGRDRMKSFLVWGLLGAGALLWGWGLWSEPAQWKDSVAYVWTAILATRILKFWIAFEACRRFGADRRSGALELLLATPLPVKQIVRGQSLALVKQFAAPAAVVLLADFIFLMAERNESGFTDLALVGAGDMIVFVADLVALGWVGMWVGLTSRHTNRAAGATLVRVLFLPWLTWGLLMTGLALTHEPEGHLPALSWIFISLLNDLLFALYARHRLMRDFRSAATQRVIARRSWRRRGGRMTKDQ